MRYTWYETYRACDCITEERYKKDLPGYCPTHGGNVFERYKVPLDEPMLTLNDDARAMDTVRAPSARWVDGVGE